MLPIAGGIITGNLGVQGNTSLQANLTAQGHTALDTLDVAGAADFADGVTIDGVDAADFATQQYVDEAVTAGGLWRGTWAADTNTPDLTDPDLHMNGWSWTIIVPDPTAPFDVPATPAIPGVSGQTVYNGDRLEWSQVQSTFVYIQGSSLSLAEAQDMFETKGQITFRPMTPDLHNWVPLGVAGMFVGEGMPLNRPIPGTNNLHTFPVPPKWRFICTSDGAEMTMTAIAIAAHPNQSRTFTKTRKAGDTWDFRWVTAANEYNLKIAGRRSRLLNMTDGSTPDFNNDLSGYRISHTGLMHSAAGWELHRIRNTSRLKESLYANTRFRQTITITNAAQLNPLVIPLTFENHSDKMTEHVHYIRLNPTIYFSVRTPIRIAFDTRVFWNWPNKDTRDRRIMRRRVILDTRLMSWYCRWVDHGGNQNATDLVNASMIRAFNFRMRNGSQHTQWRSVIRILNQINDTGAFGPAASPNQKTYVFDIDMSPNWGTFTLVKATGPWVEHGQWFYQSGGT